LSSDDVEYDAAVRAAREQAVKLLARREHAPLELSRKLGERGHESQAVEQALAQLEADNLLSPARFAESFVRARVGRGKGPLLIRAELGARRIAQEIVEQALTEVGVDWAELAREARIKRFGRPVPTDFSAQQKQRRFLQQRGFDARHMRLAMSDQDDE
jgi:regulatory protein